MKKIDVIAPQAMQYPIAYNGAKNTIPVSATGTNLASETEGFPLITEKPINQGGLPPQRTDFNGLFYTSTDQKVFLQNGGIITFNNEVSTKIGGYPQGAILDYLSNNQILKVQSLTDDNNYDFVANSSYIDDEKWKILFSYKNQDTITKWDKNTSYNISDIVFSINNNLPSLFYSKTDNNTGNNPLTDTTNWGNLYDYISSLISGNFATNNLNNLTPEGKGKTFLGIDMTGGIDFNATTARGCYYVPAFIPGTTTNVVKANGPYSTNSYAGTLVVQNGDENDTNYVFQEFNCVTDKLKWFRNKVNGTWGQWVRQASGLPNYSAGVIVSTNGAANAATTSTYTPTADGIISGRVDINTAGGKANLVVKDSVSNADILVIFGIDNGDKLSSTVPVVAGMSYQITTKISSASDISTAIFYPYMQ